MNKRKEKLDYLPCPAVLTNHDAHKIEATIEYDTKFKLYRIDVKLKSKKSPSGGN